MTSMNAPFPSRARCTEHGLILDDLGHCTRCSRQKESHDARGALRRMVGIAVVILLALVMFRVVSMVLEALPSRRVAATATARGGARLVVYTTTSCPACRLAKGWMDQNGVVYEERRVDVDDGARGELTALGKGTVVPTFVVDDEVLSGFDVRGVRLSKALQEHGLR
ncbi:hypothetical protein BH11MYX4_BH11MYX4_58140 [soil metagenome]